MKKKDALLSNEQETIEEEVLAEVTGGVAPIKPLVSRVVPAIERANRGNRYYQGLPFGLRASTNPPKTLGVSPTTAFKRYERPSRVPDLNQPASSN